MTRGALWTKHRPLAYAIAREFYLPGAERKDVEQEALIGLWIATSGWDRSGGASFKTFANLVIRRRLGTIVKAALRQKHRALNESVRVTTYEDGGAVEEVAIVDTLIGGQDPLEVLVEREAFRRLIDAIGDLSELEREGLLRAVNGEGYAGDKRIDNAATRARRKLRAAA